jgi:hypothetical protein
VANSVSFCEEFCVFLEDEKNSFKGFVGNRFIGLWAYCPAKFYEGTPTHPHTASQTGPF